ncbi:adenosylcobinamide-GDP ribazoletransferase [Pararhodobacter sp. SW119]|uniref:adenosylcobinamide-GDP ribazoletransferase n=1 Tax=Pararhodobacter sp. SW119 TaxID=2780075 RepID=UPI001ADF6FC1|nr:adenosylcobinamide-GDP ribazoletransferase [Pararhodobacter sp. SW119]
MRGARAALNFLTRLPAGRLNAADFAAAPGWFATVGLLVGAAQAGIYLATVSSWGVHLAALSALVAGIILTGALHEDGLADTCDALGSSAGSEKSLEIMRDPRIGSFGALALGLTLGASLLALAELGPAAPGALVSGQALSRGAMTLVLIRGPYLRAQGAGTGMTGPLMPNGWIALLGAVAVALALSGWIHGAALVTGLAGLALGASGIWWLALRRWGGITGDVLGACQQVGLLGFWLGLLAWL